MAFRFRRSISLVPGVRLNLGKRGVSLSAGPRGATVTAGRQGVHGNIGAPGTGLSYRTRLDRTRAHDRRARRTEAPPEGATMALTLQLAENGTLSALDEHRNELPRATLRKIIRQNPELIRQWLEEQRDAMNGNMALILDIHEDAPGPDTPPPEFEPEPFPDPRPEAPAAESPGPEPEMPTPKKSCFAWIIPGHRKRAEARYEEDLAQWQREHAAWSERKARTDQANEQAMATYRQQLDTWQARRHQHERLQNARDTHFDQWLREDPELMATVLESELDALDWPFPVAVDFDISDDAKTVWLDVDLPNTDVMPYREARLGAREDRLVIKDKSARQLREEYALHIHGVVLRLTGTVLVSLPGVDTAVISAYRQSLNKGIGFEEDEYLLSAAVPRADYFRLNFDDLSRVDPVAALPEIATAGLRRNMTKTGLFRPVEPMGPAASTGDAGT